MASIALENKIGMLEYRAYIEELFKYTKSSAYIITTIDELM